MSSSDPVEDAFYWLDSLQPHHPPGKPPRLPANSDELKTAVEDAKKAEQKKTTDEEHKKILADFSKWRCEVTDIEGKNLSRLNTLIRAQRIAENTDRQNDANVLANFIERNYGLTPPYPERHHRIRAVRRYDVLPPKLRFL